MVNIYNPEIFQTQIQVKSGNEPASAVQPESVSVIGKTLCLLGDSWINRDQPGLSTILSVGAISVSENSLWWHLNDICGSPFDIVNVSGVTGQTVEEYIQRFDAEVKAYNPDYVHIQASVNEFTTAKFSSFINLIAKYRAAFSVAKNAGIKIISNTIAPNVNIDSAAKTDAWARFNQWLLRDAANEFDITVLDYASVLIDPASTSGAHNATYMSDGAHLLPIGVGVVAKAVKPTILSIVNRPFPFLMGVGSGTLSGNGFINPNVVWTGATPGTPNSYVTASSGGSTRVCSKVVRTDIAGNWAQFVHTGTAAHQSCTLAYSPGPSVGGANQHKVGDIVQFAFEYEIDAATALIPKSMHFIASFVGSTGSYRDVYRNPVNSGLAAMASINSGVVLSPRVEIPPGTTSINMQMGAWSSGVGDHTFRVGRHMMLNHTRGLI